MQLAREKCVKLVGRLRVDIVMRFVTLAAGLCSVTVAALVVPRGNRRALAVTWVLAEIGRC